MNELIWNVYRVDRANSAIGAYNVFDNKMFSDDVTEILKEDGLDKDMLSKKVDVVASKCYRAKYEHEIGISHPFDRKNIFIKTDVYGQLKANWEHFINYLWKESHS